MGEKKDAINVKAEVELSWVLKNKQVRFQQAKTRVRANGLGKMKGTL